MSYLVLSGIENIPKTEFENSRFLGPWCFLTMDNREYLWSKYVFTPLCSDSKEIRERSDYTSKLTKKFIEKYADELNKYHGRDYSVVFWSVLLSPWVSTAVQVIYDRYLRIKRETISNTQYKVILFPADKKLHVETTGDFKCLVSDPGFNHYIMSTIIHRLTNCPFNIIEEPGLVVDSKNAASRLQNKSNLHYYILRKLKRSVSRAAAIVFARISSFYIDAVYGINFVSQLRMSISLSLKRMSATTNKHAAEKRIPPALVVEQNTKNECNQEFEGICASLLEMLLPNIFLSDFESEEKYAKRFLKMVGSNTKHFVLGPVIGGGHDREKYIAALFRERQGKLVLTQHGSNYGTALSSPYIDDTEYSNSDYFLTWGWNKHAGYKINTVPLPSPMLSTLKRAGKEQQNENIILIGTYQRCFPHRFDSEPQPEQFLSYRDDKVEFLQSLSEPVRTNVYYRGYPVQSGAYPDEEYVKQKCDFLTLHNGKLLNDILRCKIVILDNPGTTLNIALAANIPVIAFWRDDMWGMCESSKSCFSELCEAEILYYTPSEASDFLNDNHNRIQEWWDSEPVQSARMRFCKRYASSNKNWHDIWVKEIIGLNKYDSYGYPEEP